jgi:hypothetical protein
VRFLFPSGSILISITRPGGCAVAVGLGFVVGASVDEVSVRWARCWCLIAVLPLIGGGLSFVPDAAAAHPAACPSLTPAQIRGAVGAKPTVVRSGGPTGGTVATGGGIAVNCFYELGGESSMTFEVYRGTASPAVLLKRIGSQQGVVNGQLNGGTQPCTPALAGYCQGSKFDEHLVPLAGLGQRALDDPGGPEDGAKVLFIWSGNTYWLGSSGPYGQKGPNLHQLLAFARLIIRIGYKP